LFCDKVQVMNSVDSRTKRRLAGFTLGTLVLVSSSVLARPPVPTDAEAQQAHAKGACGQLGPGTGLRDGKGWIVSMMPGKHEFRVRGGQVYLTTARVKSTLDFDIGRLYYISIEGAPADAVLEWRILGSEWGPVSKYFLYPPTT
jgi:hypothetical protein